MLFCLSEKKERARATFREAAERYGKHTAFQCSPLANAGKLRTVGQVSSQCLAKCGGVNAQMCEAAAKSAARIPVPRPVCPRRVPRFAFNLPAKEKRDSPSRLHQTCRTWCLIRKGLSPAERLARLQSAGVLSARHFVLRVTSSTPRGRRMPDEDRRLIDGGEVPTSGV